MLDGQKEVHQLTFDFYARIFCGQGFAGRLWRTKVAKGAGRRPCPLFGIRRVRFSGVRIMYNYYTTSRVDQYA